MGIAGLRIHGDNHLYCQLKYPLARSSSITMAPVELDTIPRDVITSTAYLKSVDKAFELPLVTDTYNEISKLAGPISPYVETVKNIATPYVEKISPMVESGFITIKSTAEENIVSKLPEGTADNIKSKLDSAKEQVVSAVDNLDTFVCQGLDQLTTRVPALKENTTELVETTKDTAVSYFEFAQEYVASFGISQIALKLGDKGLQITADVLELSGLEETKPVKPVVNGIKNVRRHARAVRRAGAKLAGIKAAKTIGEASVVGAVAEVFGLNFFLSVVGLQLVPANILQKSTTAELDTTEEEEETVDKLSDEQIAGYKSDGDPDYVPSGATEESADDDSDAEEKVEEVVEELTEEVGKLKEVVNEVIETTKNVVEEVELKMEDIVEEVEGVVEKTEDTVEEVVEDIGELIEEIEVVAGKTEENVEEVVEDIEELIEEIEEVVAGKTENVVEEAVEEVRDVKKVEDVVELVTETIEDTVKPAVEIENISDVGEADLAEDLD